MSLEAGNLPTPELGPDPAPVRPAEPAPEATSSANPYEALKQPGDAFFVPKDAPYSATHEHALMEPPPDGGACWKTVRLENGLVRTSSWGGDDGPEDDGEEAEKVNDLVEAKILPTPEQGPSTLPAGARPKASRTVSEPPKILDVHKKDPNVPGVVTIKPFMDGVYERIVDYPDGSFSSVYLGDWGDLAPDPEEQEPDRADRVGADALACRLAESQAGKWLFSHAARAWFVWDGAIWRRDRRGLVAHTIREALREAGNDTGRLVALVEACARSEPAFAADVDGILADGTRREDVGWDADPFRLGTPGGTVDLATGTLAPADRADRITRATAVTPAEAAECPLWRRFLDETMGGDQELIGFLQRYLGYALTGDTSEHALVYGLGEGGNGKSVLVNTVRGIMGDYALVAAPDLLARSNGSRTSKPHSSEIAMLAGARLVTASETEEGRIWAEGRLKLLTGGDPVTARFLGADFFTFTPRLKLFVIGNHMPVLRNVDAAIRRRLCIVPFANTPATPDRRLEAKLKAEWPAILRWMIEGVPRLARRGSRAPGERPRRDGGLSGQPGPGRAVPRRVLRHEPRPERARGGALCRLVRLCQGRQ